MALTNSSALSAVLALAAALAIAMPLGAQAQILFDSFDTGVGHFNDSPTYSGSTAGITTSSTATQVTTSPIEGAGCLQLLYITNGASAILVRQLSGGGASGNNINFTTTGSGDGWIGCFLKTTNTGWTVQFWLSGASVNGGVPKSVASDGQWHVYEWSLDDTAGDGNGWGSVAGIITGSATVANGSHYINSVIFRNTSAAVANNAIYMDFVAQNPSGSISNLVNQPCLATPAPGLTGPLSTNEHIVRVTGVSSTATAITIYQNAGTGYTNTYSISSLSSPPASTNITVPAGRLIKGALVGVTQTISGQEACIPSTGEAVGGGASPSIRIAASIGQSGSVAGPVGTDAGGVPSTLYWIHATGADVAGGLQVTPSTNWQTIAFYPTDSKYTWNGTFAFPDPNQYGVLDGFAIACGDTSDSGPFQIYFDNLRQATNGTQVVIQNFEGNASGVNTVLLYQPSFSSTTSGGLDPAPNTSVISSTVAGGYASTGTNSLGVNFQFASAGSTPWLRLFSGGPNGSPATPYPVVDLTQPIFVDVLLLPVGQTVAHALGEVSPANVFSQTNCAGGSATLGVTVTPPNNTTPTYSYVWKHNGTAISGATAATYTKNNLASADSGTYTVTVSDGIASATLTNLLAVPVPLSIDSEPQDYGPVEIGINGYFGVSASISPLCPCAAGLAYQWYFNGSPIAGATSPDGTYQPPNVQLSDAGSYFVVVSNMCDSVTVTSTVAMMYVYDPNVTTLYNCGTGILGLYYTNRLYTSANPFADPATGTNIDSQISFDFGSGNFDTTGWTGGAYPNATDYFCVRWVGTIQAQYPGQTYEFFTTTDDGVRLWVDGNLLIDKWQPESATTWSGSIALGTNPVDLVMEYFENTGVASAVLAWESASVVSNTVPTSALCAADPSTNIPPRITVTSPANNSTSTNPTPVTLTASVTQESATVNSVKFFNNGTTLLATIAAPGPYTTTWTPPAAGVYNITAQVAYNTTSKLNTETNKLTVTAPSQSPVTISNISGTTLTYGGGAGSQFVLLTTNNVAAPLANWTRLLTNSSTPGSFTIPAVGSASTKFYRIKSE